MGASRVDSYGVCFCFCSLFIKEVLDSEWERDRRKAEDNGLGASRATVAEIWWGGESGSLSNSGGLLLLEGDN